jgi:hypothetical protein
MAIYGVKLDMPDILAIISAHSRSRAVPRRVGLWPETVSGRADMVDQLPLPPLLSQALVAFTIELDDEFEHQMPHRTRNRGSTGARAIRFEQRSRLSLALSANVLRGPR